MGIPTDAYIKNIEKIEKLKGRYEKYGILLTLILIVKNTI